MKLLRKLLFPFSAIYYIITLTRNRLYNSNILKSKSYDIPLICIGNLNVGGTGKSPMTEYVVRKLLNDFNLATLSRGYGRKTKGYIAVSPKHTASEVGDEPLQFTRKFPEVSVAVCEDRRTGIDRLLAQKPAPEVIILDDAYQHRKVKPGFSILLTAYGDLFTNDYLLPAGNLREPRSGAQRADVVIVTKCPPDITEAQKVRTVTDLKKTVQVPVLFGHIEYATSIEATSKSLPIVQRLNQEKFTLVTGIANPKPLVSHLESLGLKFEHLKYSDHHHFTTSEIEQLRTKKTILTTEKDYVRLKDQLETVDLYYLPIVTVIDDDARMSALLAQFLNR